MARIVRAELIGEQHPGSFESARRFFNTDDLWGLRFASMDDFEERYRWVHINLGQGNFYMISGKMWIVHNYRMAVLLALAFD